VALGFCPSFWQWKQQQIQSSALASMSVVSTLDFSVRIGSPLRRPFAGRIPSRENCGDTDRFAFNIVPGD
jgi:hypothetical protein